MRVEISPATPADSAGIAHVQITSYRTAYAPFFPRAYLDHFTVEEQTQDWVELLSAENRDPVFVARKSTREIVGYALGRNAAPGFFEYDCELVALHVLPQYQRQGIGAGLFAAMARDLKAQGSNSLMLWSIKENPARVMYDRLGGALIGEKSYEVDEMTIVEVAYGWPAIDDCIERLAQRNGV